MPSVSSEIDFIVHILVTEFQFFKIDHVAMRQVTLNWNVSIFHRIILQPLVRSVPTCPLYPRKWSFS